MHFHDGFFQELVKFEMVMRVQKRKMANTK